MENEEDIQKEIIEGINKQGLFSIEGSPVWRTDKLLLKIKQGDIPLFMKIPLGDTDTKEVDKTYQVHNLMNGDDKYLEPIIGKDPYEYFYTDDFGQRTIAKGIVIARASTNLRDHSKKLNRAISDNTMTLRDREDELFQIILNSSYGLQKAHKHGILHMDVKRSNIMKYPSWWGMGDFGSCSLRINGSSENNNRNTKTINKDFEHMSYELFDNLSKKKDSEKDKAHFVDCGTDIFALGVTYYETLNRTNNMSPRAEWEKINVGDYCAEWVLQNIESKKEFSPKEKYFLRRMLGPAYIIGEERQNYRYSNLSQLITDAKSWNNKTNRPTEGEIVTSNFKYKPFLKDVKTFLTVMNKEKTILDDKKLIADKSIETIVNSYESIKKKYDNTDINTFSEAQQAFNEATTDYQTLVREQGRTIRELNNGILKKVKASTIDSQKVVQDYLNLLQKTGLWGPPLSAFRYTLDQTNNYDTHYYRDKTIAGWLKKK